MASAASFAIFQRQSFSIASYSPQHFSVSTHWMSSHMMPPHIEFADELEIRETGKAIEKGGQQAMPLMQIVLVLIVVGIVLWLINRFIPMQGTIKGILNAVVVIVVVLWLLNVFGLMPALNNLRVGSWRS
jgi:hypothetical protein